jgi:hypothetical protein
VVSQPDPDTTTVVAGVFLALALASLGLLVWAITTTPVDALRGPF